MNSKKDAQDKLHNQRLIDDGDFADLNKALSLGRGIGLTGVEDKHKHVELTE